MLQYKIFMKSSVVICLILLHNFLFSMNELGSKSIKVYDKYKQQVDIPHEVLTKFITLKDCLESISPDSGIPLPFETQTIDNLVSFVEKKKKLKDIPQDQIPAMWRTADYLNYQDHESLVKLTRHYKSLKPNDCVKNKLNKIFNDISMVKPVAIENKCLDLSHQLLDRLSQIKIIPQPVRESVTYLNIGNNNLATLNLEEIFKCFPHLKALSASNNKIKKIKSDQFPDEFHLDLSHNKLKFLPKSSLIIHEGSIDLTHNYLTREIIEQACNPASVDRIKKAREFKCHLINHTKKYKFVLGCFALATLYSIYDLIYDCLDSERYTRLNSRNLYGPTSIMFVGTLILWSFNPSIETIINHRSYKKPYIKDGNQVFLNHNPI